MGRLIQGANGYPLFGKYGVKRHSVQVDGVFYKKIRDAMAANEDGRSSTVNRATRKRLGLNASKFERVVELAPASGRFEDVKSVAFDDECFRAILKHREKMIAEKYNRQYFPAICDVLRDIWGMEPRLHTHYKHKERMGPPITSESVTPDKPATVDLNNVVPDEAAATGPDAPSGPHQAGLDSPTEPPQDPNQEAAEKGWPI